MIYPARQYSPFDQGWPWLRKSGRMGKGVRKSKGCIRTPDGIGIFGVLGGGEAGPGSTSIGNELRSFTHHLEDPPTQIQPPQIRNDPDAMPERGTLFDFSSVTCSS